MDCASDCAQGIFEKLIFDTGLLFFDSVTSFLPQTYLLRITHHFTRASTLNNVNVKYHYPDHLGTNASFTSLFDICDA